MRFSAVRQIVLHVSLLISLHIRDGRPFHSRQAIDAIVIDEFNRAAPRGVGNIKCAGNYAPDVKPSTLAKAGPALVAPPPQAPLRSIQPHTTTPVPITPAPLHPGARLPDLPLS